MSNTTKVTIIWVWLGAFLFAAFQCIKVKNKKTVDILSESSGTYSLQPGIDENGVPFVDSLFRELKRDTVYGEVIRNSANEGRMPDSAIMVTTTIVHCVERIYHEDQGCLLDSIRGARGAYLTGSSKSSLVMGDTTRVYYKTPSGYVELPNAVIFTGPPRTWYKGSSGINVSQ